MPQFVTNALALLAAAIPVLLAFGGVTTAVNQFVQRFVAPKFPKFGSVVNTICVDYVEFVSQLANLESLTHSSPKKLEARSVAREVSKGAIVLLVLALAGCSSFLHWSSPAAQAVTCDVTAALMPEIEALADATGIPVTVIEALYGDACTLAAARGLSQHDAEQEALGAVKTEAVKLAHLGAKFPAGGAQ